MSKHDDYLDPDRAGLNDEVPDNDHVKEAFADHDGPYDLYRSTYKYTACGPGVGMLLIDTTDERRPGKWVYCSSLPATWKELDDKGLLIAEISVSSIIEGVDYDTGTYFVPALASKLEGELLTEDEGEISNTLARLFWKAVEDCNEEACQIWDDTHGCDGCIEHWAEDSGVSVDHIRDTWDSIPVWKACPQCGGHGTVI